MCCTSHTIATLHFCPGADFLANCTPRMCIVIYTTARSTSRILEFWHNVILGCASETHLQQKLFTLLLTFNFQYLQLSDFRWAVLRLCIIFAHAPVLDLCTDIWYCALDQIQSNVLALENGIPTVHLKLSVISHIIITRFHCIAFDWIVLHGGAGLAMHCQDGWGWLIGSFAAGGRKISTGEFLALPSAALFLPPILLISLLHSVDALLLTGEMLQFTDVHQTTLEAARGASVLAKQSGRRWLQSISAQNLISYIRLNNRIDYTYLHWKSGSCWSSLFVCFLGKK